MSLILPNKQPAPQPGMRIEVKPDGANVVLQVMSIMVFNPDEAKNLAHGLLQAAIQAETIQQAVQTPLNLPNGIVR